MTPVESPPRLEDVVDALPLGLGVLEAGRYVWASAGLYDLLGATPSTLLGSAYLDWVTPAERGDAARQLKMPTGNALRRSLLTAEGTATDVIERLCPVGRAAVAQVAFARDKALDHDARNDLHAILTFAELLGRQELPAKAASYVSEIGMAAGNLLGARPIAAGFGALARWAELDKPWRILIVDDSTPNAELIVSLLGRFPSVTSRTAMSRREARAEINHFKPHLVLVDRHLPDGDGRDLLVDLTPSEVAFIAMTADTHTPPGWATGFARVITKPFDIAELLTVLVDVLRHRVPTAT